MKRPAGPPKSTPAGARSRSRQTANEDEGVELTEPIAIDPSRVIPARASKSTKDSKLSKRSKASEVPEKGSTAERPPTLRKAIRDRRRLERREMRRFTAGSRKKRRAWFIGVGAVLSLAAIAVLLAFTPLFSVRQIVVEGAERVSSDAVIDDLETQLGTPFPLIDQAAVKAALVKYPLIRSFTLESRPPDTLLVRIVERTPIGVVASGDTYTVVDAAGVVIEARPERPDNYPLIQISEDAGRGAFESASEVLRSVPDSVLGTIDTVTASSRDDVTFTLRETSTQVVWGSAVESALKAAVLASLLTQYPEAPFIDVSSPDVPVVRAE